MPTWGLPPFTSPTTPAAPDRTLVDLEAETDGYVGVLQVGVRQSDGSILWSDPAELELDNDYAPLLFEPSGAIDKTLGESTGRLTVSSGGYTMRET